MERLAFVLGMGLAFVLVQVLAVREKQLGVAQDKAIRVVDGVGHRLLGIVLTAEAGDGVERLDDDARQRALAFLRERVEPGLELIAYSD